MAQRHDDLFAIAHHMTGSYQKNSTFLEDAEYSRALDTFVKGVCSWMRCMQVNMVIIYVYHKFTRLCPALCYQCALAGCADVILRDAKTKEVTRLQVLVMYMPACHEPPSHQSPAMPLAFHW
jgi:hypothetical protein